jgi:hypothetical protein
MVVGCRCRSLPLVADFRVSVVWHRLLIAMTVAAEVRYPALELLGPTLYLLHTNAHNDGLIDYIDTKAKCRHLKKLNHKGTLRQVCLRPTSLLGFGLGWSSNFVGFESGQIQSVKLLPNMVSNRT